MRAFDAASGVTIEVPSRDTGHRHQAVRAWCISLHADFSAAAKLTLFMDCTSAYFPHRGSNRSRTNKDAFEIYNSVPQYSGLVLGLFKPKYAFAQQYQVDIDRNGVPRYNWFMRFKAFNQIVKKIAEGSNYKNIASEFSMFGLLATWLLGKPGDEKLRKWCIQSRSRLLRKSLRKTP
eukprot:6185783-Pleurochrysis_carterae.AAC.1